MNLNLKNKVIIVTGGSKGIGFGICMGLIKEGAIPHIVGRKINDIKNAIKVLQAEGGKSCLLYTSPSPRDGLLSRMPSSA